MANDTAPAMFQGDTNLDDLPQAVIMAMMSTSDVTAADIKSNIDVLFHELYTTASEGLVLQAGLDALRDVRGSWRFMQENTDGLTRTGFSMQLSDRILHDASIYSLRQDGRHALAVRELVFNLNFAFSQDGPTPLDLRYLRRRLIGLLDQLDTQMQAGGNRPSHLHELQTPTFDYHFQDTMPHCKIRYKNLCAFARDLTRENIDLFAWEDIMSTAFNRALNNMPSRMSARGSSGDPRTWRSYLNGAKAWVNYDVVQKSLLGRRVSHETWRLWQDMFTAANSATANVARQRPHNSLLKASRDIDRALERVSGHNQARRTQRSYTPRQRLLRISAST